jgi:hypothetical protein
METSMDRLTLGGSTGIKDSSRGTFSRDTSPLGAKKDPGGSHGLLHRGRTMVNSHSELKITIFNR